MFYCQRCKAKWPPEILPPVRTSLFGYFTVENKIVTRIKDTAIRRQTLCRVPCLRRALLKESVIYVASVFKVLQSCMRVSPAGKTLQEVSSSALFSCHKVWFAHVRNVVNNISKSALHKSVCIIATLLRI